MSMHNAYQACLMHLFSPTAATKDQAKNMSMHQRTLLTTLSFSFSPTKLQLKARPNTCQCTTEPFLLPFPSAFLPHNRNYRPKTCQCTKEPFLLTFHQKKNNEFLDFRLEQGQCWPAKPQQIQTMISNFIRFQSSVRLIEVWLGQVSEFPRSGRANPNLTKLQLT